MNKNSDPRAELYLLRGGWGTVPQLKFFQTSGIVQNAAHILAAG